VRRFRGPVASLLVLVGLLATAAPASAHANLLSVNPADSSVLDQFPDIIEMTFNEAISVDASTVELINSDGGTIDATIIGHGASDSVLLVEVGDVPEGLYSLRWSAFSTADGHVTRGMLVWGVGDVDLAQADFATPSEPIALTETALRWVMLSGLALALGTAVVATVSYSPMRTRFASERDEQWHEDRARGTERVVGVALPVAAIAGAALVAHQIFGAIAASPQPFGEALDTTLFNSAWGRWALIRIGFLGLAWLLWRIGSPDRRLGAAVGSLGVALVATAAAGHAAASDAALFSVTNDAIHLAASLAWAGGLFALLFGLRTRDGERHTELCVYSIRLFSPVAMVLASVSIITGLLAVGGQARTLDALIGTFYGQAFITKLSLVAFMLVSGLLMRVALSTGDRPRTLKAETGAAAAVLLIVAVITASSPANGIEWRRPVEVGARQLAVLSNDVQIAATVAPNVPGQNFVLVDATSTRRTEQAPFDVVLARITPLDVDVVGSTLTLEPRSLSGEFEAATTAFSVPGRYELEVVVRRVGRPDEVANFEWVVGSVAPRDVSLSDAELAPYSNAAAWILAILVLSVVSGRGVVVARRRKRMRTLEAFSDFVHDHNATRVDR